MKKETILSGVLKFDMSTAGPEFQIEAVPEKIEIEGRKKNNTVLDIK